MNVVARISLVLLLGLAVVVGVAVIVLDPARAVELDGTSAITTTSTDTGTTTAAKQPKDKDGVPRVRDDVVATDEDTSTTVPSPGVLGNDGPGKSPLTVTAVDGDTGAVGSDVVLDSGITLRVDADGPTRVDPGPGFQNLAAGRHVTEDVAITVTHASGKRATSTLTIRIDGVNDDPSFDDGDVVEVEVRSDAAPGDLGLALPVTDVDDGDVLTWTIDMAASDGTATVVPNTGVADYLPNPGFSGRDQFVVRVEDGQGGSDTITVVVDVQLAGPVAVDDVLSTDEDTPGVASAPGVLANDLEGLDGPLAVVAVDGSAADVGVPVTLASGATVTVQADGTTTLDPAGALESLAPGGADVANVTVTVANTVAVEDTATLTLEITGVNDEPVIDQGDAVAVDVLTTASPGDLGLTLTATDPDDPDSQAWSIDDAATNGTASVDSVDGTVDYLPDANFEGVDDFVVAVEDQYGGRDTIMVTVTVTPPNSPPVIDQGPTTTVTMSEDGAPTAFDLTLTATDPDLDALSWAITSDPADGTAGIVAPATGTSAVITYTPATDFNGSTTFEVTVSDTVPTTDTITVTVTVEPVNDPPTVTEPGPFDVIGNVGITVPDGPDDLLVGAADAADGTTGLPLSVTPSAGGTTQGGAVSVAADGAFSYRPPAGYSGADAFTYEVCDSGSPGSACTTGTVDLTVSAPIWFVDNSAPAGGTGTLGDPFASTAALAGTTLGDVYLAETGTDYTTGITLGADQTLVGEGATGASLAAVLGRTVPAYSATLPAINGTNPDITPTSGNGITLASGNRVLGVDVEVTGGGAGIRGTAIGTVTIDDVGVVSSAAGPALDLANGGGTIDVGAVSTSARSGPGIVLANVGGTVGIASATIPNPTNAAGNAVQVTGSSAAITIGTATISNTVVGTPTTFDDARGLPTNDGDGDGIFLKGLTGSFTLNGGSITSFGDNAVDIRDSRNVTLSGVTIDGNYAGNSGVQAHVAQDITIVDTTIREIDDVNATPLVTDSGMRLTDVEGTLTIQRSTISLSEGYVLANASSGSANRAVELDNGNGCTHDGDADCTLTVTVTGSTFEDWDFQGLSLRHVGGTMTVSVDGTTADGTNTFRRINGAAVSTGPSRAAASHSHTTSVTSSTFDQVGIAAEVFGSRGGNTTTTMTNNTVTTTTSDALRLVGFNQLGSGPIGTYRATVAGNTITGVAGHLHGSGGGSGVFVAAEDSSVVRAVVQNNTITGHTVAGGNVAEALRTQNQRNGQLDLTFRNNTVSDFPTNFFGAVYVGNDSDSNPADGVTSTCADLGGNSYANAAGSFANTHGFDALGNSVIELPGYTGTTDAALTTYLNGREATTVTPLVFGYQPVNGTCTLP